jgi:hypothetical protein
MMNAEYRNKKRKKNVSGTKIGTKLGIEIENRLFHYKGYTFSKLQNLKCI